MVDAVPAVIGPRDRGVGPAAGWGRHRWKVERAVAWLLANRRRRLTVATSAAPTS